MADNTGEWHRCPVCKKGGPNTRPLPKIKKGFDKKKLKKLLEDEEEE